MTKQWKKSLEQTDIVSDGEAFDGANIDQPISDISGGLQIPQPIMIESRPDGEDISISGAGVFISISARGDGGTPNIFVDGQKIADSLGLYQGPATFLAPFSSLLEIKFVSADYVIAYSLE